MTSVAVVVLDTVRADAFDEHFDWLDGLRFDRAYSTSHWTVPAHASLFTGRYASTVGVHGTSPTLDCDTETLAEGFSDAGYRTRAFSANAQLNQYEGWDRGFDEFVRTANLGRTDDDIFDWGAHIDATDPGLSRNLSGLVKCFTEDVDTRRSLRYGYDLLRTESYDGGGAANSSDPWPSGRSFQSSWPRRPTPTRSTSTWRWPRAPTSLSSWSTSTSWNET